MESERNLGFADQAMKSHSLVMRHDLDMRLAVNRSLAETSHRGEIVNLLRQSFAPGICAAMTSLPPDPVVNFVASSLRAGLNAIRERWRGTTSCNCRAEGSFPLISAGNLPWSWYCATPIGFDFLLSATPLRDGPFQRAG